MTDPTRTTKKRKRKPRCKHRSTELTLEPFFGTRKVCLKCGKILKTWAIQ